MKKRIVAVILSLILCTGVLAGCDEELKKGMDEAMNQLVDEYKDKAKDMVENLAVVLVVADAGKVDDTTYTMPLYVNAQVLNSEVKNPVIKIKNNDCLVFLDKSDGWNYSGNTATKRGSLAEGVHSFELEAYCKHRERCEKEFHLFKVQFSGENSMPFETGEITIGRGARNSQSFLELEKAMDEYIAALNGINTEKMETPEKTYKKTAMEKIKGNIDINLNRMINPPNNKREKAAMTECIYMAIFDAYLANNMKEETSWYNKKYYENISPSDFSDGCISAAGKIVSGTEDFIETVLEDYQYTGTYLHDGYQYEITIDVPFKSVAFFKVEIVAENGRRFTYNDTTAENNLDKAKAATSVYMAELIDLYQDANIAAVEALFGEVKNVLAPCETKAPSYTQKKEIKGALGKIDKKVARALEKYGLAGVNEFFGYCWEVYDVAAEFASFAEMCDNEDDVMKVAREAKKQKDNMEELLGRANYGTSQNASTKILIAAQKKLVECIENVYDDCVKELGEEPEPKQWWEFWK